MHIQIGELVGKKVLTGATHGRNLCTKLLERIDRYPSEPKHLLLDFGGVDVATASFLRECVLEFRDTVRRRWPELYPVVANANEDIVEELRILTEPYGDVLALCSIGEDGRPERFVLLGELDPKQKVTLDLVTKLGEADAAMLMTESPETEQVGRTAWNNRLASLTKLGLLMESTHGRSKRYRPVFSE